MGAPGRGHHQDNHRHPLHDHVDHALALLRRLVLNTERMYRGAPDWEADTIAVPAGVEATAVLTQQDHRRHAYVTNTGANPVTFGPTQSVRPGGPNTFTLAAGAASRRLDTTAEVWAVSAAGTTVDVVTFNDPD